MPFSPDLRKRLLTRFDELIAEGQQIAQGSRYIPAEAHQTPSGGVVITSPGLDIDRPRLRRWTFNVAALLHQVVPPNHPLYSFVEEVRGEDGTGVQSTVARLTAIGENFERGLLGDPTAAIEAEISMDYMGQAERLLAEGAPGKYDHVPAAVLAGAVLEKSLRDLCQRQSTPIAIEKPTPSGGSTKKMMMELIDDLKKAGVYNEARAKQLRGFAAIRNHAAHGEFDQFGRAQVEQMIAGIEGFLADYLK